MTPIVLGNAQARSHKFKLCTQCDKDKPPEGGIEMQSKWICHPCWIRRVTTGKLKGSK